MGVFTEMTLYYATIELSISRPFTAVKSSWWQKMSCVKGTPLPKSIFQQMFFVSCCEPSEWQPTTEKDKKKRQEYNILDVIFQKLLTQNVLHESSISKCACIKEIVHQQNLTESHLNIK